MSKVITVSATATADPGYVTTHGWVYNSTTGDVWAAGFDANDKAYPR